VAVLSGEFRKLVTTRGAAGHNIGLEDERIRKVARAFMRCPEVRAEGFNFVTEDYAARGRGGGEIGNVEIAFLVFAGLEQGPINEELGVKCWQLYTAPILEDKRCPVTGHKRAGDVVRDILADPQLAVRVRGLGLWREVGQVTVHWKPRDTVMFGHPASNQDLSSVKTIVTMEGKTLLWLAQMTKGKHPISRRH
jgi:hypothetical protein